MTVAQAMILQVAGSNSIEELYGPHPARTNPAPLQRPSLSLLRSLGRPRRAGTSIRQARYIRSLVRSLGYGFISNFGLWRPAVRVFWPALFGALLNNNLHSMSLVFVQHIPDCTDRCRTGRSRPKTVGQGFPLFMSHYRVNKNPRDHNSPNNNRKVRVHRITTPQTSLAVA